MARTAPAPDIPPIPGMCPSIAVLAGGGDAGGGSGASAGDGSGDENAGAGSDGENAAADSRGAPDYEKYPECGYASHPVDVVTGRAFTHPVVDLELPGPLPLVFSRSYSSKMAERDVGLGFGWGHTFGWKIEVGRRRITVWNEQGVGVDFPMIPAGAQVIGPWGWVLRRETWGYAVDADDGLWHLFSVSEDGGKCWRLSAIEDRNRNRIALTYEDGRLVEVKDSAGRIIRITPTREGRIGSIHVLNAIAQGQWVAFATYTYDDDGNLVSAMDADGFAFHYEYDDDHRLTLDQDRAGLAFHFAYDREGRCVESWGDYPGKRDPSLLDTLPKYLYDGVTKAKGIHHCKFEYGANGSTDVTDSTQVRRFFGTKHGTLSKKVVGGGVMTATYSDDGHLLARTDAMGATMSFDRDARGRLLRLTDPLGRVTTMDRDANGLVVSSTDPAGAVTLAERDAHGNVLILTDAAGGTTSARYDTRGLPIEVVSPTGARTSYTYDAHGNLITIVAPNGGGWRFTYDAFGRRVSRTDPLGAETRYAYSTRGDLTQVRDALGGVTRYSYDGERHLTQIVGPNGQVTELTWGGYHKLCGRRDPNGNLVRLRYNLEGELLEIHNERGEVHRLEYSSAGRLVGEVTFDGRKLRYKHDLAGRIVKVTNGAGERTTFVYDLAGQFIGRELPDGSTEEFSYDARGDLIAAKNATAELLIERDATGRIVREVQIVNGNEQWAEVSYDADGNRIGRRTSLGHTEAITRGALGERTATVFDDMHRVEHRADALGREIARALPSGGWMQTAYDPMGRVVRHTAGGASRFTMRAGEPEWLGPELEQMTIDAAYRYDATGELVGSYDRAHGSVEYRYDPVGQLLAAAPEKAREELFRYDPTGNVYEANEGARGRVYGQGNRLVRCGDTEYVWDADGRLVEKRTRRPDDGNVETWRYGWDGAGLLRQVERPDGLRAEFAYDPFARRLTKRVTRPSATRSNRERVSETRFVWDGDVLVHAIETRAREDGDPIVEHRTFAFEDEGFKPVAHKEQRADDTAASGTWFHYVNDPSGAPSRLVDEAGAVAAEYRRTPLGALEAEAGARTSTPLRLQGQYHDEETGLSYNRFRYYADGVFMSADPLGVAASTNSYAFPPNTFGWADPSGLLPDLNAMSQSQVDAHMRQRAQRLHSRMPEESQGRRTTAVGLVEGPNGRRLVYAVSDNRTCAPQRRSASRGGEQRVTGEGQHAEQILINNTPLGPGERLVAIAPSRPACGPERANCRGAMGDAGIRILDP